MGERCMRTRGARSAVTSGGSRRRSPLRETHRAASAWIGPRAPPPDRTDAAEVMMPPGPAPDLPTLPLERGQERLVPTGLRVHDPARRMEARAVDRGLRLHALVQHRS